MVTIETEIILSCLLHYDKENKGIDADDIEKYHANLISNLKEEKDVRYLYFQNSRADFEECLNRYCREPFKYFEYWDDKYFKGENFDIKKFEERIDKQFCELFFDTARKTMEEKDNDNDKKLCKKKTNGKL